MPEPSFALSPILTGHSVAISAASGEVFRWGPDEPDPRNVPLGISCSTSMPGGFKSCTLTLPRRIDQDYADLNLFDNVQVFGAGNEIVWEGRVAQLPRSHQGTFSITVGCIGWSAHLMDDASFREIYIDQDLSSWGEPSIQRRINLNGLGYSSNVPVTTGFRDAGAAGPGFLFDFLGVKKPTSINIGNEVWYHASGIEIGFVKFNWTGDGTTTWVNEVRTPINDVDESADALGFNGTSGTEQTLTASAGKKYVSIHSFYVTAVEIPAMTNKNYVTYVKVLGRHGLTVRGTWPEIGVYASDVVADVVSRAAPLLNYTTGAGGTIQATSFVIPQLAFKDPTMAQDVLMLVNGYHLWDWGVWENKKFYFNEPNPEVDWQVRLSDGAKIDLEGTQAEDVFNGVFVTYTDPGGVSHTVGPPGSGADGTSTELVDTSPTNPVNAHGIPRRWAMLSISQTTTEAAAIQLGRVYLAEKSLPQRRGTLTLTGQVQHATAGMRPAWAVRAGDWVRIADHPTDTARKVIETQYDATTQTVTCSLDNTSHKLDAILERLGVSLMGVV